MDLKIDFVLTWVDGADAQWLAEKEKYIKLEGQMFHKDSSTARYRDWNNLRYWFRGVEKFAPWVNNIYFVTWGHVPQWLNLSNPKLKIINHKDFIPAEYLPTFSINVIEDNLYRIKGLSEHFVYFNDDMFLINAVSKKIFFKNGKPVDSAILTAHCYSRKDTLIMTPIVDIGVINEHFDFHSTIKKNFFKWFNLKYKKGLLQNAVLYLCPRFPGIAQHHLPDAFLKSTFVEIWDKEKALLDETCKNKFRCTTDVNQWLFREWQLASGKFLPRRVNIGKSFFVDRTSIDEIVTYIKKSKKQMICINDREMSDEDFDFLRHKIIEAFSYILPEKSSYEK